MSLQFMGYFYVRERTIWQMCIVKHKIDVNFSFVCPIIDNEFRHEIFKAAWGSPPVYLS